jgi:hypothetical protein
VSQPAEKDYIAYWSAGQLLVQHGDPYASSQVLATERIHGYKAARPLITRNPPPALFLTIPLGWVGPRFGLFFWTAAALGCIIGFLHTLEIAPPDRILAYFFAPVFACFVLGQSSPFLLLGFALFLRFHRSRPFAAGAALLLMAIKPLLFLAFWPLLLIDCLYRRNFRLLAGGAVAIGGATLFAMYLDPQVWPQYLAMLRAARIDTEFLPTPALLLRCMVDPKLVWLQFVPSCIAIAWGIWFYSRNRRNWSWHVHGMPLMFVTVLVSPYAWTTDEIVLLPAMMAALANPAKPKHSVTVFVLVNGFVIIMLAAQVQLTSGAYAWTSSAWLGWYLYSHRGKAVPEEEVARDRTPQLGAAA